MIEPDDAEFYYMGRFEVGALEYKRPFANIKIKGVLEPYKYKNNITTVARTLAAATDTVTLKNSRLRVIPEITVTATTQLILNGVAVSLTVGTHINSNIILSQGDNIVTLKGTKGSKVTFKYQEGEL